MSAVTHETVLLDPRPDRPTGDADFVIRWRVEDYHVTAEAWSAVLVSEPGQPDRLEVWDDDSPQPPEDARNPDLRVSVKWDGCANWDLSPTGCQYHTCGAAAVRLLGSLLAHLHRRALELIPNADPAVLEEARK